MKHLMTVLGALIALAVTAQTAQANLKKDYCSNQTYYTDSGADDGNTYPHLHCGKNFLTYSSGSNHYNFVVGDQLKTGTAGSACYKAADQSANNLKAKIADVCSDEGETCSGC